jgi:DNA-binding XRE family transcriptional regulator
MISELATLRSKKTGVLLKKMRENHSKSENDCANWLGIASAEYRALEIGEKCASLPQIESLSYYLDFPFAMVTSISLDDQTRTELDQQVNRELVKVRNKTIGILLKQQREQIGLSLEDLSVKAEINPEDMVAFESGAPVPFSSLLSILDALQLPLDQLYSQEGPFKHAQRQPAAVAGQKMIAPSDLPQEIADFVAKPANLPYLELAMRISKMDANKIRSVASSLLEITY